MGALEAAATAYVKAAELSSDEAEQADFTEQAGRTALQAGFPEEALRCLEEAMRAHGAAGRVVDGARVTGWLGQTLNALGQGELAIIKMRQALASLEGTVAPPEVVADLQAKLGVVLIFSGHGEEAAEAIEAALTLAQHFELVQPLAQALGSKATLLATEGRPAESQALYEMQATVSRRHGLGPMEANAEGNLADLCMTRDLPGAEEHCQAGLEAARRAGGRQAEAVSAGNLIYVLILTGRFDEAYRLGSDLLLARGPERLGGEQLNSRLAWIESIRGNAAKASEHLEQLRSLADSDNVQSRVVYLATEGFVALAQGDPRLALGSARRAIDEVIRGGQEFAHEGVRIAFPDALDAAAALSDAEALTNLVELVATRSPGEVPPFLRAQGARGRALLAAVEGRDEEVEADLVGAEASFRELGYPYWTARAQLDRAEWLARQGRAEEADATRRRGRRNVRTCGSRPGAAPGQGHLEGGRRGQLIRGTRETASTAQASATSSAHGSHSISKVACATRKRSPDRHLHQLADDLGLLEGRVPVEHDVGRERPDVARQAPAVQVVDLGHARRWPRSPRRRGDVEVGRGRLRAARRGSRGRAATPSAADEQGDEERHGRVDGLETTRGEDHASRHYHPERGERRHRRSATPPPGS